jgi:hypothetical protein
MKEIMDGWHIAKKHGIEYETDGQHYHHGLLGECNVMTPEQVHLPLNVLELLESIHGFPPRCAHDAGQKKSRFHHAGNRDDKHCYWPPGNRPLRR